MCWFFVREYTLWSSWHVWSLHKSNSLTLLASITLDCYVVRPIIIRKVVVYMLLIVCTSLTIFVSTTLIIILAIYQHILWARFRVVLRIITSHWGFLCCLYDLLVVLVSFGRKRMWLFRSSWRCLNNSECVSTSCPHRWWILPSDGAAIVVYHVLLHWCMLDESSWCVSSYRLKLCCFSFVCYQLGHLKAPICNIHIRVRVVSLSLSLGIGVRIVTKRTMYAGCLMRRREIVEGHSCLIQEVFILGLFLLQSTHQKLADKTTYGILSRICIAIVTHELFIVPISFLLILVPNFLFLVFSQALLLMKTLAKLVSPFFFGPIIRKLKFCFYLLLFSIDWEV